MKIYTGQTTGRKLDEIIKRDMGIMISSSPAGTPNRDFAKVYCALDNGAFSAFKKGYPFQQHIFIDTLKKAYSCNIPLDFIVCPDIVCGGMKSLDFSIKWAKSDILFGSPNLALVVQDGMTPEKLDYFCIERFFNYIFIGGSVEWKWKTAATWVEFGRKKGFKIHIGQCGKLKYLLRARDLSVDSVDSTSWCINESWHIIDEFKNHKQLELEY